MKLWAIEERDDGVWRDRIYFCAVDVHEALNYPTFKYAECLNDWRVRPATEEEAQFYVQSYLHLKRDGFPVGDE